MPELTIYFMLVNPTPPLLRPDRNWGGPLTLKTKIRLVGTTMFN